MPDRAKPDANWWPTFLAERGRLAAMPAADIHSFVARVDQAQRVVAGNLSDLERHCSSLAKPEVYLRLSGNNPEYSVARELFLARACRFSHNFLSAADGFRDIVHRQTKARARRDQRWTPVLAQIVTFDKNPHVAFMRALRDFFIHEEAMLPLIVLQAQRSGNGDTWDTSCTLQLDRAQVESISRLKPMAQSRLRELGGTLDIQLLAQQHFGIVEKFLAEMTEQINLKFGEELVRYASEFNEFRERWKGYDFWQRKAEND